MLLRRGLDQASVDDVVQEVALRALSGRVAYESAADLFRWAAPVAAHVHVDLVRHSVRWTPYAESEPAARDDVAAEVADRIELQRTLRCLALLPPGDRHAILTAVRGDAPTGASRRDSVRMAVRRHRARARLARVLRHFAGLTGALALLRTGRRVATTAAAFAVPVVLLVPLVPHITGTSVPRASTPAYAPDSATETAHLTRPGPVARVAPVSGRPARVRSAIRATAADPSSPGSSDLRIQGPGGTASTTSGHEADPEDSHLVCWTYHLPPVPGDKVCIK